MSEIPHRRYVLIVKIEADTKEALIQDVRNALFEIETKLLEREKIDSVTGGIDSSRIVMYSVDDNVDHDSYWQSCEKFMGKRKQAEHDTLPKTENS